MTIRKLPFPYKAALAISNDVDNTPSLKVYIDLMNYLNGNFDTPFGRGLSLEVGNSFWFFNNTGSEQLSYFKENTSRHTSFSPFCREFIHSGHIDILHTYGNFDEGGFARRYAEISINELVKHDLCIKTWVNHGTLLNSQNIGHSKTFYGAVPCSESYHFDILVKHGLRYGWLGRMTHVLGQDALNTINIELKNLIQTLLFNVKYKQYKNQLFDIKNRLMVKKTLQDGNEIWDFLRFVNAWGREKTLDINDLSNQLKQENINRLVSNEGFLIVYTHFCEGLFNPDLFPLKLRKDLEHISNLYSEKKLLLTTTTRLLQYYEVSNFLTWTVEEDCDTIKITISPFLRTLNRETRISADSLQGLTFYCSTDKNIEIYLNGNTMKYQKNTCDYTGRTSVSIPWIPLKYPVL